MGHTHRPGITPGLFHFLTDFLPVRWSWWVGSDLDVVHSQLIAYPGDARR